MKSAAAPHDITAAVQRPPLPGEIRYAVAIEDQGQLWLTLWVKRRRVSSPCLRRADFLSPAR